MRYAVRGHDDEAVQHCFPVPNLHCPFLAEVAQCQIVQLDQGLLMGKWPMALGNLTLPSNHAGPNSKPATSRQGAYVRRIGFAARTRPRYHHRLNAQERFAHCSYSPQSFANCSKRSAAPPSQNHPGCRWLPRMPACQRRATHPSLLARD